jgi:hypothetical protein
MNLPDGANRGAAGTGSYGRNWPPGSGCARWPPARLLAPFSITLSLNFPEGRLGPNVRLATFLPCGHQPVRSSFRKPEGDCLRCQRNRRDEEQANSRAVQERLALPGLLGCMAEVLAELSHGARPSGGLHPSSQWLRTAAPANGETLWDHIRRHGRSPGDQLLTSTSSRPLRGEQNQRSPSMT